MGRKKRKAATLVAMKISCRYSEEEEEDDDDDGDGDGDEEAIVLNCLESYKESFKKVGMKNHEQRKKEIKEK